MAAFEYDRVASSVSEACHEGLGCCGVVGDNHDGKAWVGVGPGCADLVGMDGNRPWEVPGVPCIGVPGVDDDVVAE